MTTAIQTRRLPAEVRDISDVAAEVGLAPELLEPYGQGVAKIRLEALDALPRDRKARYVVVTAITPTPLGEGKTVTTIGLGDGLRRIGRRAVVSLRQGSMGPTFGVKGGAAGGGRSTLVPFDKVALHLTGDMHAVAAAHNLLAAMLDNHLFKGNTLDLDRGDISWRRVIDVDDRALRHLVIGLGTPQDGVPRQSGFDITAASEVMAVLALSTSLRDLRGRLGRIVIGHARDGRPVTAEELHAAGAMAVLLRDAVKPNLVQTLEGTPAIIHAGPFGNIAHGNSSVIGDMIGIRAGDFLVTEAGFGADMGAERFFDIKCRVSGLRPDAAVVVATVRGLKAHSGNHRIVAGRALPPQLFEENPDEVLQGGANLRKQVENCRLFGVPVVVCINAHPEDHRSEHGAIRQLADQMGVRCAVSTSYAEGGDGAADLARAVAAATEEGSDFRMLYPDSASLEEKIEAVATRVFGAAAVAYDGPAVKQLRQCEKDGFGSFPVCIAKTQLSLSSDPKLKGAPTGWTLPIREVRAAAGAGFVFLRSGEINTMPGLPAAPVAERVDIDEAGNIVGLF
ncbi:MAG: formate--tetrahydrofolate ligase [Candidatus Dormibacteria bacterium]|jgi:formate--tetrahydrofolate ligase